MTKHQSESDASPCQTWVSEPWLGFDTETTGISPKNDRVVTAAAVTRQSAGHNAVRTWLINPGVSIPPQASAIHGITTEYAREHGQDPREGLDEVNQVLADHMTQGRIVVVFNAGYDLPLLEADSRRHGIRTLEQRLGGQVTAVADPLVLDRAVDPYRKGKRTLSDMSFHYGIDVPVDTHQAHVDSTLTLDVLAAILGKFPKLAAMTVDQLFQFQRDSHASWAKSFQDYLASKGRNSYISTRWF